MKSEFKHRHGRLTQNSRHPPSSHNIRGSAHVHYERDSGLALFGSLWLSYSLSDSSWSAQLHYIEQFCYVHTYMKAVH